MSDKMSLVLNVPGLSVVEASVLENSVEKEIEGYCDGRVESLRDWWIEDITPSGPGVFHVSVTFSTEYDFEGKLYVMNYKKVMMTELHPMFKFSPMEDAK